MEDRSELHFFLDEELEAILNANRVDIVEALRARNVPIQRGSTVFAFDAAGSREKDAGLVLVGTAAVIATLTPVLVELVRSLTRRDIVVEQRHLRPVQDSRGNVVRNKDGRPLTYWTTEAQYVEPPRTPVGLEIAGFGIRIKLGGGKHDT